MEATSNVPPRRARLRREEHGFLLCWEDDQTEPSFHGSIRAAEEWAKLVERYDGQPEPEVAKPE